MSSEVWKRWESQVADHKYQLQQFVGSTDHSVVFFAEYRDPQPHQAAIKFIAADIPDANRQLAEWDRAAALAHPNLIKIVGLGRCKMDDMQLLYLAMERADENLGEVLPQRALTHDEAKEMLKGVVDALVELHRQNLVHGHIKPSNILAIGDQLKLSSDTIRPAGELREMRRESSAYDAPEITSATYTAASDVWSLGVSLVEALTQQPAVLPYEEGANPVVPPQIREPLREIARQSLRRNPVARWSSARIAEQLIPAAVAAKATAAAVSPALAPTVAPLSVPLSKEPAAPLGKTPQASVPRPPAPPPMPRTPGRAVVTPKPPKRMVLPNYVLPLFAAILAIVLIIALPKILRRQTKPETNVAANATSAPAAPGQQTPQATGRADASDDSGTPLHVDSAPASVAAPPAKQSANRDNGSPSPAILRATPSSRAAARNSRATPGRGEVLDQVMPKASSEALASIQGTVRVGVKVHVDAAGNVSEAALDAAGPSRYFADLSLKTARGWVFGPPEVEGRSAPSEWVIRFEFTPGGVHAYPHQISP